LLALDTLAISSETCPVQLTAVGKVVKKRSKTARASSCLCRLRCSSIKLIQASMSPRGSSAMRSSRIPMRSCGRRVFGRAAAEAGTEETGAAGCGSGTAFAASGAPGLVSSGTGVPPLRTVEAIEGADSLTATEAERSDGAPCSCALCKWTTGEVTEFVGVLVNERCGDSAISETRSRPAAAILGCSTGSSSSSSLSSTNPPLVRSCLDGVGAAETSAETGAGSGRYSLSSSPSPSAAGGGVLTADSGIGAEWSEGA
jgi:hypothetical protein